MLEGLFDVSGPGAFWVALASALTSAACWVCSRLTLTHGARRIQGLPRTVSLPALRWLAIGYAGAPVSVLAGIYAVSDGGGDVLGGSALGLVFAVVGWQCHRRLYRRMGLVSAHVARWLDRHPHGYRDRASGGLHAGHLNAAQFTGFFVAIWGMTGLLKYLALKNQIESSYLPASLAFLVLLLGVLALTLSGLAFFFDRYRVPVLLPWILLLALASLVPGSDHYLPTIPVRRKPLPKPSEMLSGLHRPVLVCASGGGIAAAAWAVQVLSSLERQNPERLATSIALFSGASGGSVGGMHFVSACRSEEGCGRAFRQATRSSLDAAAWGLVGPDLLRAVVPFAGWFLGDVGRGWALEQAWDPGRLMRSPMSAQTGRPALVFNATLVETGEPVGLANVDLGGSPAGFASLLNSRRDMADLSLVTAARLSASFPYVTPTARPPGLAYHFADGGYYDNYGVGAAVSFVDRAYSGPKSNALPRRLLLIEIRATQPGVRAPVTATPLLFQWLSPLLTILNVRDTAQRERNDTTLNLLTAALAARGVELRRVVFEIPRRNVPLSWHLTARQTAAMREDWNRRFEVSPESRAVAEFLSPEER